MGSGLYKTNIVWSIDPDKSDAIKYYNRLKKKGYEAKVIFVEKGATGWSSLATAGFVLNNASRLVILGHGAETGRVQGPFGKFWDIDELVRQLRGIVGKDYYQLATFLTCFSGGVEEEFEYIENGKLEHVKPMAYSASIGYKFIESLPGTVEVHARNGLVISSTTSTEYVRTGTTSSRGVNRPGSGDKVIFKREEGQVKVYTRGF